MDETYLLTVEAVFQTGDNADIFPTLPADKFYFESVERIKIVSLIIKSSK